MLPKWRSAPASRKQPLTKSAVASTKNRGHRHQQQTKRSGQPAQKQYAMSNAFHRPCTGGFARRSRPRCQCKDAICAFARTTCISRHSARQHKRRPSTVARRAGPNGNNRDDNKIETGSACTAIPHRFVNKGARRKREEQTQCGDESGKIPRYIAPAGINRVWAQPRLYGLFVPRSALRRKTAD